MVPGIESIAATLRAYGEAAGAIRALVIVDGGGGEAAAMVEWTPAGLLATVDEEAHPLQGTGEALELPALRQVPASAIHVDMAAPAIHAPVGSVSHLVEGVRALAGIFGGLSVATADFATADPDVTLTLAAREGEPTVAAVGEAQFLLE